MIERAPSGAYVEEWHRLPGSTERLIEHRTDVGHRVYVAGDLAVVVNDDRSETTSPFDVEFSICEPVRNESTWRIVASTLPGRIGEDVHVGI